MERFIKYISQSESKMLAAQHISTFIGSYDELHLETIIRQYRTCRVVDFDSKAIPDPNASIPMRISHIDAYYFCIDADNLPERFKMGGSYHPGPRFMDSKEDLILAQHFVHNQVEIMNTVMTHIEEGKRQK